jgi:hypothetical protein
MFENIADLANSWERPSFGIPWTLI